MNEQPLTISLVQSNLFWEDKKANLEMFEDKISNLKGKTEVVILPEMFSTGFSMNPASLAEAMDGETVSWMKRIANENKVIVTGSLIIKENGKYYNRLIWMLPTGKFGIYDKRHLFSYAGEEQFYSQGNTRCIASVKGWKINLQICYDLRFPVWSRQGSTTENIYDVLVYVANWPAKRKDAWKTLLAARAIENQCFVVGVNRVGEDGNAHLYEGESSILDPLGNIIFQKKGEETVITYTLSKEMLIKTREHFPFLKDADDFIINN
ncbi:MAG: amidohydrolase [Ginsengibacter sp.]